MLVLLLLLFSTELGYMSYVPLVLAEGLRSEAPKTLVWMKCVVGLTGTMSWRVVSG